MPDHKPTNRQSVASEAPNQLGMLPEKIPFIKPRSRVKSRDPVKVGSVIFEDKRNPEIPTRRERPSGTAPDPTEIEYYLRGPRL